METPFHVAALKQLTLILAEIPSPAAIKPLQRLIGLCPNKDTMSMPGSFSAHVINSSDALLQRQALFTIGS